MSKRNLLFVLFAFTVLVIASCEKEDDDDDFSYESMGGDLMFDIAPFVLIGEKLNLSGYGLTSPDNDDISYSWTGSLIGDNDTIAGYDSIHGQNIIFEIPDTLGSFELKLVADVKDLNYAKKEYSKYIITINPEGGSISEVEYGDDFFIDIRDNQKYFTTKIGNLEWFSQNLNWEGAGKPFGNADAIGHIMGRLYTWNDATGGITSSGFGQGAQGACPKDWSVPTHDDWVDLAKVLSGGVESSFFSPWDNLGEMVTVNGKFNGTKLWPYSPVHTSKNMYNWAGFAAGYGNNSYSNYYMLFERGFWWSSTQYDDETVFYRYIYYDDPDFPFSPPVEKDSFAASIRCVRLIK